MLLTGCWRSSRCCSLLMMTVCCGGVSVAVGVMVGGGAVAAGGVGVECSGGVVDRRLNVGFFGRLNGIVLRGSRSSGILGTMILLASSHLVPPVLEQ